MTRHSHLDIPILVVLANRVGNFKRIAMELQNFKICKTRSKLKTVKEKRGKEILTCKIHEKGLGT
jgi:hypothetical protein